MLPELIAKHDIHKATIPWWAMLPELIARHDIHKVTIPWWAMMSELIAKHGIHKGTIPWWAMLPELIAKHDIHKVTIPWWAMLPELIAKHDILKQQQSPDSICCLRSLLSMIYQSLMDYAELFNSINTFSFLKCFLLRFCSEVGLISISVSAALLFVFSKFFYVYCSEQIIPSHMQSFRILTIIIIWLGIH